MHIWLGECHVHAGIDPADIGEMRVKYPDSDLLIHPECGCVTQTMYRLGEGDISSEGTHILSTEGMVRHAASVAEARRSSWRPRPGSCTGSRRRSRTRNSSPATPGAVCQYMKRITLPKVLWSLENLEHKIDSGPGHRGEGEAVRSTGWSRSPKAPGRRRRIRSSPGAWTPISPM